MSDKTEEKCPRCGKETLSKYRPFCSDRCAKIDLGKWFGEEYKVAVVDDSEDSEVSLTSGDSPETE